MFNRNDVVCNKATGQKVKVTSSNSNFGKGFFEGVLEGETSPGAFVESAFELPVVKKKPKPKQKIEEKIEEEKPKRKARKAKK